MLTLGQYTHYYSLLDETYRMIGIAKKPRTGGFCEKLYSLNEIATLFVFIRSMVCGGWDLSLGSIPIVVADSATRALFPKTSNRHPLQVTCLLSSMLVSAADDSKRYSPLLGIRAFC